MSELTIVLGQLNKDIELWHTLLMDAIKNNDLALEMKLTDELTEMKDMVMHIEKPEFHRHLRLIQNEQWREFHEVK